MAGSSPGHGVRGHVAAVVPVAVAGAAGLVAGVATLALYGLDWGLVLVVLTCVGALLLLPPGAPRAAATGGWVVVVLLAARGGPGGDVVVPSEVRTLFLLLVGVLLVLVTALTWAGADEDRQG